MSAPRIAIVTGSSQGIGLETCRQLADQDLHVILTARAPEQVDRGLAALDRSGSVEGEILDVVSSESVEAFFASLLKKHDHLDVLVNNAGSIFQTPATGPDEAPSEAILNAVDTNTLGAWRMIRKILPIMERNGYGRIVNVSSGMGSLTEMGGGSEAYRISKTALNAVTRIVFNEVRGNIKINSVCPGWVRTAMGGRSAPRSVSEGAEGIVWAATLPDDGPSGGFFRDGKPVPW